MSIDHTVRPDSLDHDSNRVRPALEQVLESLSEWANRWGEELERGNS